MHNDEEKKKKMKVLGFAMLIAGVALAATAFVDFFVAIARISRGIGSGMPRLFFLGFIGLPLIAFGSAILKFAYMGKIARYTSNEVSPVIKDTANFLLDGTRDSIAGVFEGIKEGPGMKCRFCGEVNKKDSRFCDNCGKPLAKICLSCSTANDADAKYCRNCGKTL